MSKNISIVSVCILTYNHADNIARCIETIINQDTEFKYEVLIGEDDSSDGTREICQFYAAKNPDKISLILRERKDVIYIGGVPTGRFNFLETVKAAKGKYIAICEGDDYWSDPNKLQTQVDFMEANPEYSMCFHNAYIEYDNSAKPNELFLKKGFKKDLGVKEVIEYWYIPTASMMYRSEMMQYPDWLYTGFGLDRAMHVILAKNGPIKYIDKPMSVYRKHESSLTSRKMTEEIANANIQKYKNIENYLQGEYQSTINMMYVRYYFKLVKVYFLEKNYRNSWKYFWKAFALKPYKTMKFFLRFASGNY